MGTFAKRLGQIAATNLESESAKILKSTPSNKLGLSKSLDATLRDGHDMRVFGLGTAASLASKPRYGRFTRSMLAVYSTMEEELDESESMPVRLVWDRHGEVLRRANALRRDLEDVVGASYPALTPQTEAYVQLLRAAGAADRATGGARLLGHLYTRYFADLFGGQALAMPTRVALGLALGTPRHYDFSLKEHGGRRVLIEDIYASLNDAGEALVDDAQREAVVAEAYRAFEANAMVYGEESPLALDATRGALNVVLGLARCALGRAR